jgi:primase-polymerase (primpol)-like protein
VNAAWLPVQSETIPAALRALPWVLWRAEPVEDSKPRKVPYRVADPSRRASSTDPATWATFEDADDAYRVLVDADEPAARGPIAGIGVVLTLATGISCIDLDHVIAEDGRVNPHAEKIVARAGSWTERSPSGTGLHIFVRGTLPEAIKGAQIELYSTDRYIAVTGHHWPGTPHDVRDAQAYLDAVHAKAHEDDHPRRAYTGSTTPPPDDLAGAVLAKLQTWGVPVARLKRWSDGYLVELVACPWAEEHTTGPAGAAVMVRASGAFDFVCQHAHCAGRRWREFRAAMESAR